MDFSEHDEKKIQAEPMAITTKKTIVALILFIKRLY